MTCCELQVCDPHLEDSPEGRFLIAVGEAIACLGIEPLPTLMVDAMPYVPDVPRPAIIVAPVIEELPQDGGMGRYEITYLASVVITTEAAGETEPCMGWQLATRDKLLRRFSGETSDSAHLSHCGDCFNIRVRPGVRFDPSARSIGLLLSRFFIEGYYRG